MNIVYMGTPDFAVTILEALIQAGHHIEMVVTQPDRPKGRGKKLQAPPVADYAKTKGLPLQQPMTLKTPDIDTMFHTLDPDVVIVAAYGRIIPDNLLTIPRYGFINVHASLLPKYRGAAPIQWALRNGDAETGISIMKIETGLDEGPVYATATLAIKPEWNKKNLFDALSVLGADTLLHVLELLDSLTPTPQDHALATYAPMFDRKDGCIDFSMSADNIVHLSRSLEPDDSIYTFINNQRISFKTVAVSDRINDNSWLPGTICAVSKHGLEIATGCGVLKVTELQPSGKKPMPVQSFLNGHPLQIGDIFTNEG